MYKIKCGLPISILLQKLMNINVLLNGSKKTGKIKDIIINGKKIAMEIFFKNVIVPDMYMIIHSRVIMLFFQKYGYTK